LKNKRNLKEFFLDLFYEKKGDTFILYDKNKNKLGTFNQSFDEKSKNMIYSDYDFKENSISCLQDVLFVQIQTAIIVHANKIKIIKIPLNSENIKSIISIFKNIYGERISDYELNKNKEDTCSELIIHIIQPKRTHYIQQAYLRNFSSNKEIWKPTNSKDKARIFVFDKLNNKIVNIGNTNTENIYGQKIMNLAKEDFFYSLYLEELMSKTLERHIPPIFNRIIIQKSLRRFHESVKQIVIEYIILTWCRPLEVREHIKESFEKGGKISIDLFSDFKLPDNAKMVLSENYLRFIHERQIMDFLDTSKEGNLVDHLLNFHWGILKARRPYYFITCDNPVIFYNSYYYSQKRKGNDFIKKRTEEALAKIKKDKRVAAYIMLTSEHPERAPKVSGVEIYLPISPEICLYLVDRQNGFKPLDKRKINKEIILQANQFLFTHKGNFNFIRKIIVKNPDCRDKKDKRVVIKGASLSEKKTGNFKLKAFGIDNFLKE